MRRSWLAWLGLVLLLGCSAPLPGPPARASCVDGVKNGEESDVDCGGPCVACGDGQGCAADRECTSSLCRGGQCHAPSCTDGVRNGLEIDLDCGGPCPGCGDGQLCANGGGCTSKVCQASRCRPAACADGTKNGRETDLDCGGPCGACGEGKACAAAADCTSSVCQGGQCKAPSCTDGVKNGAEPDRDCGGTCPGRCPLGGGCGGSGDCTDAVCDGGKCRLPTSCGDLKRAQPAAMGTSYPIDPDGPGAGAALTVTCDMTTDGGGWTLLTQAVAAVLDPAPSRTYLYLSAPRWYRSPPTFLTWDWNTGKELAGSYAYFNGTVTSAYTCNSSAEKPAFGVGCSSGGGNTPKTLPTGAKDPTLGQGTICQDTPNAYGGGVCQAGVSMYVR